MPTGLTCYLPPWVAEGRPSLKVVGSIPTPAHSPIFFPVGVFTVWECLCDPQYRVNLFYRPIAYRMHGPISYTPIALLKDQVLKRMLWKRKKKKKKEKPFAPIGSNNFFTLIESALIWERVWSSGTVQDSGSLDREFEPRYASPNVFVSLGKIFSLNCFVDLSASGRYRSWGILQCKCW